MEADSTSAGRDPALHPTSAPKLAGEGDGMSKPPLKVLWENQALRVEQHGKLAVLKANTVDWWLSVGQLTPQHAIDLGRALQAWGEGSK